MDMNGQLLHSLANLDQQAFEENKLLLMNYVEVVMVLKVGL